jgi:diguanylate cyclase (GGDEF)-like protein
LRDRRQASATEKVLRLTALMLSAAVVLLVFDLGWSADRSPHSIPWLTLVVALMVLVLVGTAAASRGYAGLNKRYASLKHLYDFTRLIGADMSAEHLLSQVLAQARTILRAEVAEVVLLEGGQLGSALYQGESDGGAVAPLASIPVGDPRVGWVDFVRDGRAIVVPRSERNVGWSGFRHESGFEDFVLAPVRTNEAVTGVLLVGNRLGDVSTFEDDDGRLLETLANHTSVAFENSLLLERLRVDAEQRRYESLHDHLTGLPNRSLFAQCVAEAIQDHGAAAVMLMDLDRFKEVNDTLGHNIGDAVLREAAQRVSACIGVDGVVARLGGDEFAVLLPGCTDLRHARIRAWSIIDELQRPVNVEDLPLSVGASIGISIAPDHGTDVVALLKGADVAMYQAKGSHQRVSLYSPANDTHSSGRLTLATELLAALASGQIDLCYQPKALLADETVIGVQALVRWEHPTRGLLDLDEFMPIAEQTGLTGDLTMYVLRAAVQQCAEWVDSGLSVGVSVSLSIGCVADPNLCRQVTQLLRQYQLPPFLLTLEIADSSILSNTGRAVAVLDQLSAAGVRLALGEFGTGSSSLTYLQRLPVDEVRIDRSFVARLANDAANATIVQSIVELGHKLELAVVAEGVEDRLSWDRLVVMGCDIAAGDYLSKPMPGPSVTSWLEARRPADGGLLQRDWPLLSLSAG